VSELGRDTREFSRFLRFHGMARTTHHPLFDGQSSSTQPDNKRLRLTGDISALASFFSASKTLTSSQVNKIASQIRELIQNSIIGESFFTDQEWNRFFYNLRALEDRKSIRMKIWIVEAIKSWCGVDAFAALPAGFEKTAHMQWPVGQEMLWILAQLPTRSSLKPLEHAGRAVMVTANPTANTAASRKFAPGDHSAKIPIDTAQALHNLSESSFLPPSYTRIKAVFTNEKGEKGNIGKGLKIATRFEDGTPGKYLGGMFVRKKGSGRNFYEQPSFFEENYGWKPVQWRWADGKSAEDAEMEYDFQNEAQANGEANSKTKHTGKANRKGTGVKNAQGTETIAQEPLKIRLLRPNWTRAGRDTRTSGMDDSDDASEIIETISSSEDEEEGIDNNVSYEDDMSTISRQQADIARLKAANKRPFGEEPEGLAVRGKPRARRSLPQEIAQRRKFRRDTDSIEPSLPHRKKLSSSRKRLSSTLGPGRTSRLGNGTKVKLTKKSALRTPKGEATFSSPSHPALSRSPSRSATRVEESMSNVTDSDENRAMPTPPRENPGARPVSAQHANN
jgi:hypothetical protein